MFIDLEMIDQWFKVGSEDGSPIRFGIFDKRVLLPIEQAAWEVSRATGEPIPSEALTNMAARSWIPLLSHEDTPEAEPGVPLYVPSRIAFLLALERQGYAADELRVIAESEEQTIDYILTTDELAYVDDDLEIIIQHMSDTLLDAEKHERNAIPVDQSGRCVTRERYARTLRMLQRFQHEGMPERYRYAIAKDAFRIRALRECSRVQIYEMERAQIRAGYSPFVICSRGSWHVADELIFMPEEGVCWEPTIHSALAHAEGAIPTIRVPGFLLQGDKVVSTRTLTPKEYEQLWRQHNLDQYLPTWSELQGQRRCLHCFLKLSDSSHDRRMYCSENCRNASKQKRYRQRHPEAVREAQKKYWLSLDEGI